MSSTGSSETKKVCSIVASILIGAIVIFSISFLLRGTAKKLTAPLRNNNPIELPDPYPPFAESGENSLSISSGNADEKHYPLEAKFIANYVFLRCSAIVAGQSKVSAWFMLDSGTTSCVLTRDYTAQAGISQSGTTQMSSANVSTVGTANIDGFLIGTKPGLPSLVVHVNTVTILDDDRVVQSIVGGNQIINENYGGILGIPFLKEYNISIDYRRKTVSASEYFVPNWPSVPLRWSDGNKGKPSIVVGVLINGSQAGDWILDVGSDSTLVTQAMSKQLQLRTGQPFQKLSLSDSVLTSSSAHVSVELPGLRSSSRPLTIDVPNSDIQALASFGGNLATDYLCQLGTITISLKNSRMYVFGK